MRSDALTCRYSEQDPVAITPSVTDQVHPAPLFLPQSTPTSRMSSMRTSVLRNRNRVGFTLPEVLVTVTLISALAAVVVPAVAGQLKKRDPSRVRNHFASIRGAVDQFL